MLQKRSRPLVLVIGALLGAALTAPAEAGQAPGAPGAEHARAPADKHGFATAHQLAGNAYLTLRAASMSEIYYPDLSTPAFRGPQFAVLGDDFLDRETVEHAIHRVEPMAPASSRCPARSGSARSRRRHAGG